MWGFFYGANKTSVYICSMYSTFILFISGGEIFFIMFIVVMVFGADKVPDIAKGLGKGMRQLKDATEDIKQEITKSAEKQGIDTSFTKDIKDGVTKVKEDVEDIAGVIKRK
ncbi:sec-independent protein translocase protein TatA [Cellulophaga sp. RHA19]|nr:sec-independent protein translocase protein TatA [Cellulophaga sp. RHA19]